MSPQHFDHSFGATPPENYERFFVPTIGRPLADDLIRAAELRPGERILDVGCGTGVVTRLAADAVGPDARVVGLDLHPGMIAVAMSVTPDGLGIEWQQGSAEDIPFPDGTFDVVLCQMTLQFVEDRVEALQEMARVLAPGGRVVLNLPGPVAPLFQTMADAMEKHIAPPATAFVEAVFSLHDVGAIEELLRSAGLHDVRVRAEIRRLSLPRPRDFLWQYVGSTPLAHIVDQADEEARAKLERDVVDGWKDHVVGEGMSYGQRVVIGTGLR